MTEFLFSKSETAKKIAEYKLPRYEELVPFPIVMHQLIDILDKYLSIFSVPGEEKLITQSMINSYVRKKIIEPPSNKEYNRTHILHLMSIGILKQVLSISEIGKMIETQTHQYTLPVSYDYFCTELEEALKVTFNTRAFHEFTHKPKVVTPLTECVRSAVLSFTNKIFVKQSIYFAENHNKASK